MSRRELLRIASMSRYALACTTKAAAKDFIAGYEKWESARAYRKQWFLAVVSNRVIIEKTRKQLG